MSLRLFRGVRNTLGAVLAAVVLALVSALPAWAAQNITLTWVRHAESTANAAGIVDTTVPGPGLTTLGQTQAQAIAESLKAGGYDGIFVSDMVRTQLTAAPLAADLGITPVVLGGLREINAGWLEGASGPAALLYALPPAAWTLGARFVPIPGGENGNGFEARVNSAVDAVYATGDTNPVLFSHGATIMAWTLMNVDNPDLALFFTHPLGNTDVVVMTGNPEDGWTLQSWAGKAIDPSPSLLTKLFVDVRALVVAPQTALYNIGQALRTGDLTAVITAIQAGIAEVATATVDFGKAVIRDVGSAITGAGSASPVPAAAASVPPVVRLAAPADAAPVVTGAPAARAAAVQAAEPAPVAEPRHAAAPVRATAQRAAAAAAPAPRTGARTVAPAASAPAAGALAVHPADTAAPRPAATRTAAREPSGAAA